MQFTGVEREELRGVGCGATQRGESRDTATDDDIEQ